jgi:hypothetical protein
MAIGKRKNLTTEDTEREKDRRLFYSVEGVFKLGNPYRF